MNLSWSDTDLCNICKLNEQQINELIQVNCVASSLICIKKHITTRSFCKKRLQMANFG